MADFTASDGTRLYYDIQGDGPPILCLAGLGRNSADFDDVLPHLEGHSVIRMDYRGRGRSDWADPATYAIPIEARDAVELLDHLGLEKTAILGTSRGGLIAMVLAATARNRLSGVCLNDIGPVIDPAGLDVIKGYIGRKPDQKTLDDIAEFWAETLTAFPGVPAARWRAEAARRFTQTEDGLELKYDPRLRDSVLAAGAQPAPDLWPLFDAIYGLPLAVIRGANSDLLAPETVAEMQRRRPDLILAEVPDRGHVPFLDEPEAVKALQEWLRAQA